jgi:hypothetical protein
MKKIIILSVLFLFLSATSFAAQSSVLPVANTKNISFLQKTENFVKAEVIEPVISLTKPEAAKSQIIAAVLCFFLGYLGIHRFYLGYTAVGILQLLTGGGFGIWYLIDLIRIFMGDLKPKDGSDYDPKLDL